MAWALVSGGEVTRIINTPQSLTVGGVTHPKSIFTKWTKAQLKEIGIYPYSVTNVDQRYYWQGEVTYTVNSDDVTGTYNGTAKDVDGLKDNMTQKVKSAVAARLQPTDWRVIREAEGGTAMANTYVTFRSGIRSEGNTKETEIAALSTINDIIGYEQASYTEVRYASHANGDINTAETVSSTRSIDKCTYFTSTDPDAEADEYFVSLTED